MQKENNNNSETDATLLFTKNKICPIEVYGKPRTVSSPPGGPAASTLREAGGYFWGAEERETGPSAPEISRIAPDIHFLGPSVNKSLGVYMFRSLTSSFQAPSS